MHKKTKLKILASSLLLSLNSALTSMATTVHITDQQFKDMSLSGVPGMIIGGIIFVLRIIGVILTMTGIYKMVTARKNGEADEMSAAMVKLVIGMCFLIFEAILRTLKIIN